MPLKMGDVGDGISTTIIHNGTTYNLTNYK